MEVRKNNHLRVSKCLHNCISRQKIKCDKGEKATSYKYPQEEGSDHNQ